MVNTWLIGRNDVSVGEALVGALGIPRESWTQTAQNRLAAILVSNGFKRYRPGKTGQPRTPRYRLEAVKSGQSPEAQAKQKVRIKDHDRYDGQCPSSTARARETMGGLINMPRRPATILQADVARIIRAAKQAGASEVVVKVGDQSVTVKLGQSTAPPKALEAGRGDRPVMLDMPHPRHLHLHQEITRHGKVVWYARAGGSSRGPRIKLHADYGTSEFWAEYQAALASTPRTPATPHEGTLAWLLERYRETTAWTYLSPATRRQRENIFLHVLETAGKQPFAKITRQPSWPAAIAALIRQHKPATSSTRCAACSVGQ